MKAIAALTIISVVLSAGVLGCKTQTSGAAQARLGQSAIAQLNPTQGNTARGTVTFTQLREGVRVVADITGLTPGLHGFHLHEKGDCSAPDATSAGGHFNPTGMPHGAPNAPQRHAGDFGNLVADQTGRARADFIDVHIRMAGPQTIVGRGVIVHAKADDLMTQPTGDAGGRVACGVIQLR